MTIIMIWLMLITPFLKHPISLGFTLLIQTILISMNLNHNLQSSWYSYILFITIIGGMMVMFMYMASICSNEKFETINLKLLTFILLIMMITFFFYENFLMNNLMLNLQENKITYNEFQETKSTFKFFNSSKNKLTMMMMAVLLLTMVSVTNISSSFEGPLKKT
uniref:NADH dehydrogenase subunit 6 n=1 Tax=Symplanella brevicephala TaxID=871677 RepID=UPI001E797245|nr:NADH dehydrogenase subunit 6 [Symplanella brevicephala]UDL72003.1 NADH dehydrogenase subunit 6 [Symplanella brevicephala]